MEAHRKSGHFGVADTLCQFRERFWTEKERQTAERVLWEKSYHCHRFALRLFWLSSFAQLSIKRLITARPFQGFGIDYAGSFNVRAHGRETGKQ